MGLTQYLHQHREDTHPYQDHIIWTNMTTPLNETFTNNITQNLDKTLTTYQGNNTNHHWHTNGTYTITTNLRTAEQREATKVLRG